MDNSVERSSKIKAQKSLLEIDIWKKTSLTLTRTILWNFREEVQIE